MGELPWTPDFDYYSTEVAIRHASSQGTFVEVIWADGKNSQYDVYLLRENSPEPEIIHPLSREMLISPLDLPPDLEVKSVDVDGNGVLVVEWSTQEVSHFHPGWLREHAWFKDDSAVSTLPPVTEPIWWDADKLDVPPSFNGPEMIRNDDELLFWLEALSAYGIARMRGLPDEDGLLEQVVRCIGVPRESNFGAQYVLEIKEDPDSNAFTSGALLQHMDMPTRECPHGLQFLFCRRNSTIGGEGVYVDGFHVAETLRREQPDMFNTLIETPWVFNNRSQTSDYRAEGPVITLDSDGALKEIRLTTWLRAPLKAPLDIQQKAYRAIRTLTRYLQNPDYQLIFRYEPGDLLAFDNRRILHGRRKYDATVGERFIEGIYADRDELYSKIRTLRRNKPRRANH